MSEKNFKTEENQVSALFAQLENVKNELAEKVFENKNLKDQVIGLQDRLKKEEITSAKMNAVNVTLNDTIEMMFEKIVDKI